MENAKAQIPPERQHLSINDQQANLSDENIALQRALTKKIPLNKTTLLNLQRLIGNRATQQINRSRTHQQTRPRLSSYASPSQIQRQIVKAKDGTVINTKNYTQEQLTSLITYYMSINDPVFNDLRNAEEDGEYKTGSEVKSDDKNFDLKKLRSELLPLTHHAAKLCEYVKMIFQAFPPSDYLYISLGSSPTILTELAKVMGKVVVADIPISDIDMGSFGHFHKDEKRLKNIYQYIHRAMRGSETARNKTVVIDIVVGGTSLAAGKILLEKYYETIGQKRPVEMLSLNQANIQQKIENLIEEGKSNEIDVSEITSVMKQIKVLPASIQDIDVALEKCTYKNVMGLRKYGGHNVDKIASGELQDKKQDMAMSLQLFRGLTTIIKELKMTIPNGVIEELMQVRFG